MNFLKSVFSDDPDPPAPDSPPSVPSPSSPSSPSPTTPSFGWTAFGGLIKTISTKSETVLETYKRDLQEFTSGLKSETQVLKQVASSSLDLGAAKAQVSLESVGHAFDSFGAVVSDFISPDGNNYNDSDVDSNNVTAVGAKYSRFDVQLRAVQSDAGTYVGEVEDEGEYERWRAGFELKGEEVEEVVRESAAVGGIYRELVPGVVDHHTFWCRYFYRVDRLKKAEFVRAKLVKRAIGGEDEDDEELSWDVDDDDDDVDDEEGEGASELASGVANVTVKEEEKTAEEEGGSKDGELSKEMGSEGEVTRDVEGEKKGVEESSEIVQGEEKDEVKEKEEEDEEEEVKKAEEKAHSEGKGEQSESGKDSDLSVVSSQPSHEEEDLGWDEIEDIGSGDEKKASQLGSPDRAELRKRLSVAEDDEDLSWDIEDDD